MSYRLFLHPFSSFSWKAMIAFHEKGLDYEAANVEDGENMTELRRHWPLGKFPVLLDTDADGGAPIIETTTIIEYIDLRHPENRLLPENAIDALDVRFMDRVFDNHVMNAAQIIVNENLWNPEAPDETRMARGRDALDTIYGWLDVRMTGRDWACSHGFSLADCAAAPSLFYADWVRRIPEDHQSLRDYRARLLARPSVSKCVEGARPYRHYFPGGAPDRD